MFSLASVQCPSRGCSSRTSASPFLLVDKAQNNTVAPDNQASKPEDLIWTGLAWNVSQLTGPLHPSAKPVHTIFILHGVLTGPQLWFLLSCTSHAGVNFFSQGYSHTGYQKFADSWQANIYFRFQSFEIHSNSWFWIRAANNLDCARTDLCHLWPVVTVSDEAKYWRCKGVPRNVATAPRWISMLRVLVPTSALYPAQNLHWKSTCSDRNVSMRLAQEESSWTGLGNAVISVWSECLREVVFVGCWKGLLKGTVNREPSWLVKILFPQYWHCLHLQTLNATSDSGEMLPDLKRH